MIARAPSVIDADTDRPWYPVPPRYVSELAAYDDLKRQRCTLTARARICEPTAMLTVRYADSHRDDILTIA
jgi:hypothetical protein